MKAVMGVLGKGVAAYFLAVFMLVVVAVVSVALIFGGVFTFLFPRDDAEILKDVENEYDIEFPEGSTLIDMVGAPTKYRSSGEWNRIIQLPEESQEAFFLKLLKDDRWEKISNGKTPVHEDPMEIEYLEREIYWEDLKNTYNIAVYERKTGRFYRGHYWD